MYSVPIPTQCLFFFSFVLRSSVTVSNGNTIYSIIGIVYNLTKTQFLLYSIRITVYKNADIVSLVNENWGDYYTY